MVVFQLFSGSSYEDWGHLGEQGGESGGVIRHRGFGGGY